MNLQTQPQPLAPTGFTTGCCPPFDPAPWHDKQLSWSEKLFLRDHVRCLFHVPLNMGARMTHDQELIAAAHAEAEPRLILSDVGSPWSMDLYIAVSRNVPGAQMTTLSGTFLTKVYEGAYRDAGKWAADMQQHVASKGRDLEKLYLAYTTCPACAKAYGKNYVVAFARVHEGTQAPAFGS